MFEAVQGYRQIRGCQRARPLFYSSVFGSLRPPFDPPESSNILKDSIQVQVPAYGREHSCEAPGRERQEVSKGTTALDVAKSISPRLADAALVAKTNGDLIDLTSRWRRTPIFGFLLTKTPRRSKFTGIRPRTCWLRRCLTLSGDQAGHGPPTETGFFYDFYRPTPFTPEDLEKIEQKMQELVQQNIPYAREFLPPIKDWRRSRRKATS